MKFSFFVGVAAIAGTLFFGLQPVVVSAQASPSHFAQQPQISALVTMAIAPYKW